MTNPTTPGDPNKDWNPQTGRYETNGHYWDGHNWLPIQSQATTTKEKRRWPWIAAAVVVGLIIVGAIIPTPESNESNSAASTTTYTIDPSKAAKYEADRQEAIRKAEEQRIAAQAEAEEKARILAETVAAQNAAKMDRTSYEVLGERDYALVVKNPDDHIGRKLLVYGYVAQFDSGTGSTQFRAYTGNAPSSRTYDFDENTIIQGPDAELSKVVKDDFVAMYVEVRGSLNYSTTMGGATTVPKLYANMIDVTG